MEAINLLRKQSAYSFVDESFQMEKEMYRGQPYTQIYFTCLDMIRTSLDSRIPNCKAHLTGVVVALHGRETSTGDFFVEDVLEAGLPPKIDLPIKSHVFFLVQQLITLLGPVLILTALSFDNIRFLGTSGQNIDDLAKYSEAEGTPDFMERTLRWRHLAPSTLGCYPFTDGDPFLIEGCPHVYFVGSDGQLVRLISIPKFNQTGAAVVLNIRNLECHTFSFGTQFG